MGEPPQPPVAHFAMLPPFALDHRTKPFAAAMPYGLAPVPSVVGVPQLAIPQAIAAPPGLTSLVQYTLVASTAIPVAYACPLATGVGAHAAKAHFITEPLDDWSVQ